MATKLASGIISKGTSYNADPSHIVRREGWNTRFDFGDIEELKSLIKQQGFRKDKPLVVKRNADNMLEIIDGDRRFTAVQRLITEGHTFEEGIPVVIEDKKIDDMSATVLMLTANNGKQFLPLEEAAAYKRLLDFGRKPTEIAKLLGKSDAHVKDRLALLSAAPDVKKALEDGTIGSTLAENIVNHSKGDHAKQKELVEKVKSGKEGKKAVRRVLDQPKKPKPAPAHRAEDKPASIDDLQKLELEAMAKGSELFKALGLDEAAIRPFIQESDERAASFYFGVMMAIRAARGLDVPLSV